MKSTGPGVHNSESTSGHTFHIPVMGTGFTIDTPLKVAKYGISSVMSIGDDILVEKMRKFYCENYDRPFEEIKNSSHDVRARRITSYLNLVDQLVQEQIEELRAAPFVPGSDINRYFDMLPDTYLKQEYSDMLKAPESKEKVGMQMSLRKRIVAGAIDVNILSKVDRDLYKNGEKLPQGFSVALSALRGFAESTLHSSVVFSAGINPRLYSYLAQFEDFFPDEKGFLKKKIILKTSDYRSAEIQGKYFAKRGLWVSEYRIESGINCGGHAFITKGLLLGPILEEFKNKKQELVEKLHNYYSRALETRDQLKLREPFDVRITVQGGIGTTSESKLLHEYYEIDSTGWATPFLLVPEVICVDKRHMEKLSIASDQDVYLSDNSPLSIPFWNLRTSDSEENRNSLIKKGTPGSPCPKSFLASNTEFTKTPICSASNTYQKLKLKRITEEGHSAEQLKKVKNSIVAKTCLCRDLADNAILKNKIESDCTPAVCCGPNIVNFSKLVSLEEMVNHIYGRISLITRSDRQHMFIKELSLYIDHLREEYEKFSLNLTNYTPKYLIEFKENLLSGIEYYRCLGEKHFAEKQKSFLNDLRILRESIENISLSTIMEGCVKSSS
ncbi:MAG: hypothetical protein GY855_16810 [candidate division Zixibacteria bacterium]|nr:hypothetical protein [candidate division Zixibacteria bacterium]